MKFKSNIEAQAKVFTGDTGSANATRFPNALSVTSIVPSAVQHNESLYIGLMAEGLSVGNTWGSGVYGAGYTNATGSGRGTGVTGEGHVGTAADTGVAVGVRGYANDVHTGNYNIGLYGDAENGDAGLTYGGNIALFLANGNIVTSAAAAKKWYLGGNLTFDGQGTTKTIGVTNGAKFDFGGTSSQLVGADGSIISAGTGISITGGVISSTVLGGVTSFNTRTGAITLTSGDVTTALGYTPTNVTIGTANGLSLSTQVLSLGLASTSANGALSSTDWNTFNGKQNQLNGTGFVKASGTTISYDNTSYLPLSGGTMTGNLFLRDNNTVGGTNYYIGQTMATNDTWKIYGNSIALDQGELVFELGDNAEPSSTNGQRFRFYYNNSSSGTANSPFILDYNEAIFNANVGMGTSNITYRLQVKGNGLAVQGDNLNEGNSIRFLRASGTEMGYIGWSNESTNNSTWLFKSSNGNPIGFSADGTNQNMVINTSGNVGIGNTSPSYKLDVTGSIGSQYYIVNNSANSQVLLYRKNGSDRYSIGTEPGVGSTNDFGIYNYIAGSTSMIIYANNNYQFFGSNVSDIRAKEKIVDLDFNATEKVMALQPKSYYMKNDSKQIRYGLIAQEVNEVLPDLVCGDIKGDDFVGLDYNGVIPVLIKAIQELKAEIEILKNK